MRKNFTLFIISCICIILPGKNFAQVLTKDSLVLVDLYNRTNGAGWIDNTGWLTSPVANWKGITTAGNRVSAIDLSANNLTGTIPDSLQFLDALTSLALGHNQLTGNIPASFGDLTALNALVLGNNTLSGSIPSSLGNLAANLVLLDLSSDQLTGSIPVSLGDLSFLNTLYLYNNQLTGTIPAELGNLGNLGELQLNNNQLTGSIPATFGTLFSLTYLDLSSNQLTDTIPASLGGLFNLNILYLYNNKLTGSIPASLGTLSSLQYLSLGVNQLSGTIPASLDTLSNLQGLSLTTNQLTGAIPFSLGKASIFFIDLSHNLLSGTVPSSFSDLTNSSTAINYNKLTFDGLESVSAALSAAGSILLDSPQAVLQLHLTGSILSVYAGGTLANDTFHWYKNGALYTTIVGDSTFSPTLMANYSVAVSNNIITPDNGLILYSDTLIAGVILPLHFLNFTGTLADNNTLLQWQTAAEINTSYFNVQRSIDGIDFTTIGKVNAGLENYHYTDDVSSFAGQRSVIYYRLQEVDNNGNGTYSNIVTVQLASTTAVSIYPDPVKDVLNINLGNNSGEASIAIFDMNGQQLIQQTQTVVQNSNVNLNASGLSSGTYFVRIIINGFTYQQKFIKQ